MKIFRHSKVLGSVSNMDDQFSTKFVLSTLHDNGIDTTKHKYRLVAYTYDRYGSGPQYTKTFTCPGDYLAYFSMRLHGPITVEALSDEFDYDTEEFTDFVSSKPSISKIEDYASECWWGDGDDFIVSLENLDTREILYKGDDAYEEEYDDDEW